MFKLASFSFGCVAIALLVTVVLVLLLIILPQAIKSNKRLSPMSYLIVALFAVSLFITNIIFAGLVKTKNLLDSFEQTAEYRTMQYASEALNEYLPEVHGLLEGILGSDYTAVQLQREQEMIKQYLWIDGAVVGVLFLLGMMLVTVAMEGGGSMRGVTRRTTSRGGDSYVRREHTRTSRGSHRRSY
jgi:hypothetical protein